LTPAIRGRRTLGLRRISRAPPRFALPCDIFLGAHGSYFGLKSKLPRLEKEGPQVFLDAAGYKGFVAKGQAAFETALKKEQEAAPP